MGIALAHRGESCRQTRNEAITIGDAPPLPGAIRRSKLKAVAEEDGLHAQAEAAGHTPDDEGERHLDRRPDQARSQRTGCRVVRWPRARPRKGSWTVAHGFEQESFLDPVIHLLQNGGFYFPLDALAGGGQ